MPSLIKLPPQANRKSALGRGLGALLQDARGPAVAGGAVTRIAIEQVHPDRANPRKSFDDAAITELAHSLKHQGVLQPVLVRRDPRGGGYRLIAGERRWRAAQKAGLKELPAIVREASDAEAYEMALVENIQREDLSALEEAEAYRRLVDERRMTQEQVADRVGKNRATVANALRLLGLPTEVKDLLSEGALDMGHARALLGLSKPQEMVALAREVVAQKLSVRDTEALVKAARPLAAKKKGGAGQVRVSPEARRLVEDLQRRLGTRVRLKERGGGKGTLEIEFFSYEDLDRIIALIRR
jgi:ParB family chromosome partitioning protein